jgi:cell division transport system permease protein
MFTAPARIFRTAFVHMQRHGWHTVAAVAVMSLTFFITSIFLLAAVGSNVILHYFEKQPQLTIFLKDEATPQRVLEIRQKLQETGNVDQDHYTSKDEAFAFYKEQFKNDPSLLENISANILPASIEITPKRIQDIDSLAAIARQADYEPFVDTVVYQKDVIDRLTSWTETGRMVGMILVGFLALVSFLIVLVTIGLNIASYKDEIEVMRLVGAGNWYIRGPFVLEGMLYGAIAAVISVAVVYFSLPWLASRIQGYLEGIPIFPIPLFPVFGTLLVVELVFGMLLGLIGSWAAMRRSLKV